VARLRSQSGRWRCEASSSSVSVDAEYKSANVSSTKFPSPHVSYDEEEGVVVADDLRIVEEEEMSA